MPDERRFSGRLAYVLDAGQPKSRLDVVENLSSLMNISHLIEKIRVIPEGIESPERS